MTEVTYERSWTQEGRPALNRLSVAPTDGPWMSEPDKVHWIDPDTDMDCLAVRNPMGAWCGYVAVEPGHPLHGVAFSNIDVRVHGGLTFASFCSESEDEAHGICHVPLPGRPHDVWWLGFDCNHAGDMSPYDAALAAEMGGRRWMLDGEYRDLAYVKAQCAELAQQLCRAE